MSRQLGSTEKGYSNAGRIESDRPCKAPGGIGGVREAGGLRSAPVGSHNEEKRRVGLTALGLASDANFEERKERGVPEGRERLNSAVFDTD